jgi:hypothetical protein
MAATFQWHRMDLRAIAPGVFSEFPRSDGMFILAQHAIDREAVLQAQIKTLEARLKDRDKEIEQLRSKYYG